MGGSRRVACNLHFYSWRLPQCPATARRTWGGDGADGTIREAPVVLPNRLGQRSAGARTIGNEGGVGLMEI